MVYIFIYIFILLWLRKLYIFSELTSLLKKCEGCWLFVVMLVCKLIKLYGGTSKLFLKIRIFLIIYAGRGVAPLILLLNFNPQQNNNETGSTLTYII